MISKFIQLPVPGVDWDSKPARAIFDFHSTVPTYIVTSTLTAQPRQNPKNRLFSTQKSPLYHFKPTGPPGIAQMQAWPVRLWLPPKLHRGDQLIHRRL